MSNCCCPSPTQPNPPPDIETPPTVERCDRYRVTIVSMDVTFADDGLGDHTLEASFAILVNGQLRNFKKDLSVGIHSIGFTYFVDVPADTSVINLTISGTDDDPLFDDSLPGFTRVLGQSENWGLGFQQESASNEEMAYALNYQITCAQRGTSVVSRAALLAYAQEKLKSKKRQMNEELSNTTLLTWGLNRLRRGGFDVLQTTDEHIVISGSGTLPGLVEQKYGKKKPK